MKQMRLPWWTPEMTGAELAIVKEVLDGNYLNEGDVTARFESKFAEIVGARHAISATSGTAALSLSLMALGVGAGDEVIIPDMTFVATANAVTLTGATPVLVDVNPGTLTMDVEAAERAITPRTKAVLPVHVSGRAAGMESILGLCNQRGLPVVEDAAEALCSRRKGKCLGTFGRTGCFSLSPAKTITTGQGGVVVTDNEKTAGRLRELKDQGRSRRGTGGDDLHPVVGFNFKFTNLQAAVGLAQLQALPLRLERMRSIYSIYREELLHVEEIRLLPFDIEDGEQPQWIDALAHNRDELDASLDKAGAGCRRFWFPLHTQTPYLRPDVEFPVSTRLQKKAIWLPSAFQMTDGDVRWVCARIRAFYSQ